jgi:acyl carrier protein
VTVVASQTDGEYSEVEQHLRDFIVEELIEIPYDGSDPLADCVIDSLGIEQLIEYIYECYDIELEDEEIVAENFESVPALAALIAAKG